MGVLEKTKKNGRNIFKSTGRDIESFGRASGYCTKPDDIRTLPRIGKKYVDIERIITEIFKDTGKPLDVDEVNSMAMDRITVEKQCKNVVQLI